MKTSTTELRQEVSALRNQIYEMEQSCQQREDKLVQLLLLLEPFLNALSPEQMEKLKGLIEE